MAAPSGRQRERGGAGRKFSASRARLPRPGDFLFPQNKDPGRPVKAYLVIPVALFSVLRIQVENGCPAFVAAAR